MNDQALRLDAFQTAAWEDIRAGHNVLVTGPAGTGKSALMSHVTAHFDRMGVEYALTALTGQAAELVGGATLHSCFGWKVPQTVQDLEISWHRLDWLARLRLLIIDEVSMLSAEFLQHVVESIEAARAAAADAAGRALPAGAGRLPGLQLVLVGDFHQLPPVVRPKEVRPAQEAAGVALLRALRTAPDGRLAPDDIRRRAPFLNRGLTFQSSLWQDLGIRVHQLRQVHRQRDRRFVEILHALREGRHTQAQLAELGRLSRPLPPVPAGILPTELHSTNEAADNINAAELGKLPAYPSDAPTDLEERRQQLEAMLRGVLGRDRTIRESVELKLGAQVVLCANLSSRPYLVNGSRGIVVGFTDGHGQLLRLRAELQRLQGLLQFEEREALLSDVALPYRQQAAAAPSGAAGSDRTLGHGSSQQQSEQQQLPGQQSQCQQQQQQQQQQAPPAPVPGAASPAHSCSSISGGSRLGRSAASQLRLRSHQRQQLQQQMQGPQRALQMTRQLQQTAQQQVRDAQQLTQQTTQQHTHQTTPSASHAAGAGPSSGPPAANPLKRRLVGDLQAVAASPPGLDGASEHAATEPPRQRQRTAGPAAARCEWSGDPAAAPTQTLTQWQQQQQQRPAVAMASQIRSPVPAAAAPSTGAAAAGPKAGLPACCQDEVVDLTLSDDDGHQEETAPPADDDALEDDDGHQEETAPPADDDALEDDDGHQEETAPPTDDDALEASSSGGQGWVAAQAGAEAAGPAFLSCPYQGDSLAAQLSKVRADIRALEASLEQAQGGPVPLPLVRFRSCDTPVCIHPRAFEHKIRNIGAIWRVQLPLMLAWAMTTHKAQGASLDLVVVDLGRCFAEGQVYVALSRARSMEGLRILNLQPSRIKTCPEARRFYARGGAALPAHQTLRFPLAADMPADFYAALQAGQPLELAAAPHLAGLPPHSPAQHAQQQLPLPARDAARGSRGLGHAVAAPSPHRAALGAGPGSRPHAGTPQQVQQQPATPATAGGSAAAHTPSAAAGGAVQDPCPPPLVPVRLQLAALSSGEDGGQGGSGGGQGEAVVVGRAFLRAHAGDMAGLLGLLCQQCGAPPGREWDLLCCTPAGGTPLRVPPGAVQLEELLAGAHGLVLRERRQPGG
ncbi:hypothetical protein ABPG75_000492 [Micractinium tetrahymenae]